MKTTVPIFRPPLKPARLAPLAEAMLKWSVRDAVNSAVRNAAVSLKAAAIAARGPKGKP